MPAPQVPGGADPRVRDQPSPPLQAHQPHQVLRGHHLIRPQVYVVLLLVIPRSSQCCGVFWLRGEKKIGSSFR